MAYVDELNDIWTEIKEDLSKTYSPFAVDFRFAHLKIHDYKDGNVIFETESEFKLKMVKENYLNILEEAFEKFFGFPHKIDIIFTGTMTADERISKQFGIKIGEFDNRKIKDKPAEILEDESDIEEEIENSINFQYTFDNFIVGASNKFAHAACYAVATHLEESNYNPLFIYGPSGLGKTHLMSAIVTEIKKTNPRAKVIYIKGEEFTNEMIECLSDKAMSKFHEKYRKCDVLLIDDIQFIAGKTSTQEEFFHTFNTLHENGKQIVLSSDRPPKDISTLEDRLKTRFEWGLIADIQPPDLELRIAIFKNKISQAGITVSDEIITFLAENLRSHIRQIEGAVKKLVAIKFLSGGEITMEAAKNFMAELLGGAEPTNVTVDKIFSAIEKKYDVDKSELIGNSRVKNVAQARHVAIYLIKTITDISYPSIGKLFNRNHSTIMASVEVIEKKIATSPAIEMEINELIKEIRE